LESRRRELTFFLVEVFDRFVEDDLDAVLLLEEDDFDPVFVLDDFFAPCEDF
jgi:hypothetical protein